MKYTERRLHDSLPPMALGPKQVRICGKPVSPRALLLACAGSLVHVRSPRWAPRTSRGIILKHLKLK
jgi:hypothetical protein